MFKLTGTMTAPDGTVYPVDHHASGCHTAQHMLMRIKEQGYTADITATVTTGAGSVTYKIIVE